jgi:hypothetical protein
MKKFIHTTNYTTLAIFLIISYLTIDFGWSQNLILNGHADEWDGSDNADAFDMTPPLTIKQIDGTVVDSPFRASWNNTTLNGYIDGAYGTNEQPNSTSDGTYVDGVKTRGYKFSQNSRRMYQKIAVTSGTEYTFSMESRSETQGVNTEVFILNTEIDDETSVDAADPASENNVDAYFQITNDFNSSKGNATENTFTTSTFNFTASADLVVVYIRSLQAVDSSHETFYDNLTLVEANTASISDLSDAKIHMYPNPTNGMVHISGKKSVDAIRVFNISGQLIKEVTNANSLDLTSQLSGLYMIEIEDEGKTSVSKLVKR